MIKRQYPIEPKESGAEEVSLTYEEANALRYTAGYIPRALAKKLKKSAHPLSEELSLCLLDLVDDDDDDNQSQDWIKAVDMGGVIHVNNMMYQLCVALELAVRRRLRNGTPPNFEDEPNELCQDESVLYYLSMVSVDWKDEEREALLPMITNLWVTILVFLYPGAWMEKYKALHHKSVQKTKGIRKLLLSFPNKSK